MLHSHWIVFFKGNPAVTFAAVSTTSSRFLTSLLSLSSYKHRAPISLDQPLLRQLPYEVPDVGLEQDSVGYALPYPGFR